MRFLRIVIIVTCLINLFWGCTYDVAKYYSESCKTSFTGFPDIPGWNFTSVPTPPNLESYEIKQIYFFEEKKGLLVTNEAIWLTENEGVTWEKVFKSSFISVFDISFSDPFNGFIAVSIDHKHGILKTNNGGQKWSKIFQQPNDLIRQFSFVDSLLGFAYMYHSDVEPSLSRFYYAKTKDGGLNWEEIPGLSIAHPYAEIIQIHPNGFGYMLGDEGDIHITNDVGASWTTIHTGMNMNNIQFLDLNNGFVSDYHGLNKTTDGGISWTPVSNFSPVWFYFFSPKDGISLQTVAYDFSLPGFEEYLECRAFFTLEANNTTWTEGPTSISFYLDYVNFVNTNLGYGMAYNEGHRIVKIFR